MPSSLALVRGSSAATEWTTWLPPLNVTGGAIAISPMTITVDTRHLSTRLGRRHWASPRLMGSGGRSSALNERVTAHRTGVQPGQVDHPGAVRAALGRSPDEFRTTVWATEDSDEPEEGRDAEQRSYYDTQSHNAHARSAEGEHSCRETKEASTKSRQGDVEFPALPGSEDPVTLIVVRGCPYPLWVANRLAISGAHGSPKLRETPGGSRRGCKSLGTACDTGIIPGFMPDSNVSRLEGCQKGQGLNPVALGVREKARF